tara:strand:+ start:2172 stop:2561 length:390 start_codon:yes stop_codon:yes gene_type:complete
MLSRRSMFKYFSSFAILGFLFLNFKKNKSADIFLDKILFDLRKQNNILANSINFKLENKHIKKIYSSLNSSLYYLKINKMLVNSKTVFKEMSSRDFKEKNVLNVNGWILSEIEVILIAYINEHNNVRRL